MTSLSALSKIRAAGFSVTLTGDSFEITPASSLTMQQREFLKSHKAEIVTELQTSVEWLELPEPAFVTCRTCQHFNCYNQHGSGAGWCRAGVQSSGVCRWSETLHQCEQYVNLSEPVPGAWVVTCWMPAGKPMEVEATSPQHAAFLKQMNPNLKA